MYFGKRSKPSCIDCDGELCTMNCGPAIPAPKLPDDFKVICSVCGDALVAATNFSKGQIKKRHPRCRACAPNKFGNRKDQGGDSRKESKRALELRAMAKAGGIQYLREQVEYELIPKQVDDAGKVIERSCSYRADFVYVDPWGKVRVEDAKGMRTDVYRLKKKLMLLIHKVRIEEV
jgi:hypothetical protein